MYDIADERHGLLPLLEQVCIYTANQGGNYEEREMNDIFATADESEMSHVFATVVDSQFEPISDEFEVVDAYDLELVEDLAFAYAENGWSCCITIYSPLTAASRFYSPLGVTSSPFFYQ